MGILNVTPDSFSDGGAFLQADAALEHARSMWDEGAEILDIGGESTRPGAVEVSADEEIQRVVPVIAALHRENPEALLSIDTMKAEVAQAALDAGASIINDVNGLRGDPGMAEVVAKSGAGLVIMHMQGTPRTMQASPQYSDVCAEIVAFFEQQFQFAKKAGILAEQIVWDPGIGFGKSLDHNLAILRSLRSFALAERPVLLGVSRKSLFHKLLGTKVDNRLWSTVAVTAEARRQGVRIHRVHDVRPNLEAMRMTEAIYGPGN